MNKLCSSLVFIKFKLMLARMLSSVLPVHDVMANVVVQVASLAQVTKVPEPIKVFIPIEVRDR